MSTYPGHSVLQVAVPALEPFVRARHAHHDRDFVSDDPDFGHAHVTVLGPFVASPSRADLEVVATIAASTPAFDFVLERLAVFPDGIVHAVPEPDGPFRTLTARVHAAFPDHPPYAGRHASVVPHLTLDALSDTVSLESTRAALGDLLPARCRAARLDLAWWEARRCHRMTSWELGAG